VIIDRDGDVDATHHLMHKTGIHTLLGVPMLAGGTVIGVLHVGTTTPRDFTDDDTSLLRLVADRIALAAQARLSGIDRAAALALQRSLLPPKLPSVPGLELAARYVTGAGGVGGDWYDLFRLPSGWLGLVIGDVVGRGLRAAVVMGRLRSALRAYALEVDDPAEVLTRLDRKAQHFEPDMMATAIYAMVEPSLERLHLSVAGHPSPVLAVPGRPSVFLDLPVDLPLGVGPPQRRHATAVDLPADSLMCFYTDGLVERRSGLYDAGLECLRESVVAGPAEAACSTVMTKLLRGEPADDDIALIAVHRLGAAAPAAAAVADAGIAAATRRAAAPAAPAAAAAPAATRPGARTRKLGGNR